MTKLLPLLLSVTVFNTPTIHASYTFPPSCELVVAPSSIPNAGLGVFTLKDLQEDDLIGFGDMIIEMPAFLTKEDKWDDYSWSGRVYNGTLDAFVPGLQSLTNSHLGLLNVQPHNPAAKLYNDDTASTPYHNFTTEASTQIPSNSELFTVYGDHWFQGREQYRHLATSQDYLEAERLAQTFDRLDSKGPHWSHLPNEVDDWAMDLWELVGDVLAAFKRRPALLHILPHYQDMQQVKQLGIRSLYQSHATREREELTGPKSRCVDGIRPGPSKIHHMGAFATREVDEGSIITGSPLLHSLLNRFNARAQVWDSFSQSYKVVNQTSGGDDYALLVNYCWSHQRSSILLCPYGVGVSYINHSNEPNVKIQWAPHGQLSHNNAYLKQSPGELSIKSDNEIGLAFDYVALTRIREGDELTIDYGSAWEDTLEDFRRANRLPTARTNVDYHNLQTVLLKTEAEQLASPYPIDIDLKCHPSIMNSELPIEEPSTWSQIDEDDLLECHVLERQSLQVSDGSTQVLYAVRVWYKGIWRGRGGIPRAYLRWFAKKEPKTFRYPMQLPDEMVPSCWHDS